VEDPAISNQEYSMGIAADGSSAQDSVQSYAITAQEIISIWIFSDNQARYWMQGLPKGFLA